MNYQDDSEQARTAFSALFGVNSPTNLEQGAVDDESLQQMSQGFEEEETRESLKDEDSQDSSPKLSPGALLVYLLKGYVDRDEKPVVFQSIVRQQLQVDALCRSLFLVLVIDEASGFAYLKSANEEDIPNFKGLKPPRLLSRRPLTFLSSFILIILRLRLVEFEVSGVFGQCVLEKQSIIDQVKAYLYNVNNEQKLDDRLNKAIDDLCELGILKASKVTTNKMVIERIEVKRIISAIVTPEVLAQADEILTSYVEKLNDLGHDKDSGM